MLHLAVPLILTMVGQMAITTTDMLMLGRLGPQALASVALGISIFHPLMLLGIGIGLAVTPLVTKARSSNKPRQMRRVMRQGIWAAAPFTLLCLPVFWWSFDIFNAIGQKTDLSLEAQYYLRAMFPGLFFVLLHNVLRSFLTAFEMTRAILIVTMTAIPLNAAFNYVLIFGALGFPALGVTGAGIGSSLSNIFMGVALSIYCIRVRQLRRYALFNRFWRADWSIFLAIHKLGIPIGLMIVLETSIFAGAAQVMGLIGTPELAAHQIAIQLASIAFMVPLGIGQAATARVGLEYGKHGLKRGEAAGWTAMILSNFAMMLTALLFFFTPEPLIAPFLDNSPMSTTVMSLAVSYLAIAAAFQIVDGLQVTAAHALRGFQDTKIPMWIAAFGYWGIAMPMAIWLGLYTELSGVGVWIGLATGLAIAAFALTWRFIAMTRGRLAIPADQR